eukprot:3679842-Prymnesium_polylepis.1
MADPNQPAALHNWAPTTKLESDPPPRRRDAMRRLDTKTREPPHPALSAVRAGRASIHTVTPRT